MNEFTSRVRLTRGFIYIVLDRVFPNFCKIGRTSNMYKRLQDYNCNKPYPSAYVYAISKEFADADEVEKAILRYMYSITSPTTYKEEWFSMEYLPNLEKAILEAETYFELAV